MLQLSWKCRSTLYVMYGLENTFCLAGSGRRRALLRDRYRPQLSAALLSKGQPESLKNHQHKAFSTNAVKIKT